jgi:hypothetical protein
MKAHKTKEIYVACHSKQCRGNQYDIRTGFFACWLDGASIGAIRTIAPVHTFGAPDDLFGEDPDDPNLILYVSLNCRACSMPVAKWNEFLNEDSETMASQITNFPLNGAEVVRLWQCGSCGTQTWDSDDAEECCL